MKSDYRYLVSGPLGNPLCRCITLDDVNAFVERHFKRSEKAFHELTGRKLYRSHYQVRDLTEVPTYEETLKCK